MNSAAIQKIDSHQHFWKYDPLEYAWIDESKLVLRRDYLYSDLAVEMKHGGVAGVVSVQARQCLAETDALLGMARQHSGILGVVGWLPLASESVEDDLERYAGEPLLKGVRHVVQDEPDDSFILGAAFNRGVAKLAARGLVYDILIYARQLTATIEFVDQHPWQQFVLDHIGKPTIESSKFDDRWATQLRELARRQNVSCKFSGVVTEVRDPAWSIETIHRYWEVALESFGPQRLMFGSDWPVCLLRTDYARWVDVVQELASEMSVDEQRAFWCDNAIRVYELNTPRK